MQRSSPEIGESQTILYITHGQIADYERAGLSRASASFTNGRPLSGMATMSGISLLLIFPDPSHVVGVMPFKQPPHARRAGAHFVRPKARAPASLFGHFPLRVEERF
jgi:hypothetical protein